MGTKCRGQIRESRLPFCDLFSFEELIAHCIFLFRWNYMGFVKWIAEEVGGILHPNRSSMQAWAFSMLSKSKVMSPEMY